MAEQHMRRLMPANVSDGFSLLFLIVAVIVTFIFELTTVIPYVHSSSQWRLFHSIAGSFIMHNILGNLWFIVATDTSTRSVVLSATLRPGWRFCVACEANAPPRAFHCPTCDMCILKRDHHCAFAGKCVGYFNFRHFWALLVHITLGALYASVLNSFFIWDFLGGFNWLNVAKHTFPFAFWLFGKLSTRLMWWSLISVIDLCGCLFAGTLLYMHTSLMSSNQTNHERNRRISTFNYGAWKANVRECLGVNWRLVLLSPLVKSQLPRDGVKFPSYREYYLNASKTK